MKHSSLSVSIFLLLFFCSPQSGQTETIILAADTWAPYNIQPNKAPEGYMIDVAREVFKAHGIDIDYRVVPWSRAIEGTRKGEYTGAVGPSTTEGVGLIFPEEELSRNYLSFWVKKGNPWRFTSHASVNDVTLGLIEKYDYLDWLNTYAQASRNDKTKVQFVFGEAPMEMNLRKLLAGRIGAVVDSEATVRFTASQLHILDKIELAGSDNEVSPCYIAFSPANPKSPSYARMLSDGIIQLRKSGRLKEILAGYGLQDWKE